MKHHPRCQSRSGYGLCTKPCVRIQAAIDQFNSDDTCTHASNPDSRYHYYARFPILAQDCDYEISGFSGVSGKNLRETG